MQVAGGAVSYATAPQPSGRSTIRRNWSCVFWQAYLYYEWGLSSLDKSRDLKCTLCTITFLMIHNGLHFKVRNII